MTDPVEELANDAQRLAAAKGLRWIPGELLVGDIGVVLELAHRLDDVDASPALTGGELGAPDRGVESCAEVDVVHHSAGLKVRLLPGHQQLAYREVCLCSVEVHARLVHLERHRLTQGAHPAMLATGSSSGCQQRYPSAYATQVTAHATITARLIRYLAPLKRMTFLSFG